MNRKKILIACVFTLLVPFVALTASLPGVNIIDTIVKEQYRNPVIAGDFPDPSIVRVGDVYYAAGTSSEWAPHFPIYTSKDLINWQMTGYVFDRKPSWTSASFWAPELFYHNDKLYVYYTARDTNNISCIGVAVADKPGGRFTDHGVLIRTGKEAIDAFVFDDSGQLYISWKAYGLDDRPIELLQTKLSADGLKLEGEPISILKDEARKGLEGQSMVKRNGYYYLFYSAGSCCGVPCDYNVRVARSASITGPYQDNAGNPILKGDGKWICTGHGTPVSIPGDRTVYLYHGYHAEHNVFTGRQGLLNELFWDESTGWPYFKNNQPADSALLVIPRTAQRRAESWRDEFDSSRLSVAWQWDFRSHTPDTRLQGGRLTLSGSAGKKAPGGNAICVRAVSGNYSFSTQVVNDNQSAKGLVLYGDSGNIAGISIAGNKVQVWEVKKNHRKILNEISLKKNTMVHLQVVVTDGSWLRFQYSMNGIDWRSTGSNGETDYDGSYLKQWDRSPRPGLIHYGDDEAPAVFSFFEMKWQ